jgi:cytochrome bd-type quinol oxidase subunit 2
MQYPVGFVIRIGQIELTDFLAVIIQTLKIMLGVPLIFVPLIIAYQALAYNFFKGKAKEQALAYEEPY